MKELQLIIETKYSEWGVYDELWEKVQEGFPELTEPEQWAVHASIWNGSTPISNIIGSLGQKLDMDYMAIYNMIVELAKKQILTVSAASIVHVQPNFPVSIEPSIHKAPHVPPMICEPKKVHKNNQSAYLKLSHNKLILGSKHNYHERDICLDVINSRNAVPFKIDWFVVQNAPNPSPTWEDLPFKEKYQAELQWRKYCKETDELLEFIGDKALYFTHGVDLRGRIYSKGFHINPQGTDYRKAMLDFAESCISTGEL